jgi:AbrB family looped-hinge helix DNA binding protein
MASSTVSSKGQTTIPKRIRERLKLKAGDRVDFTVEPDGGVRLRARNLGLSELRGILPKPKRRLSADELNAAIRESWGERWRRFEKQPGAGSARKRRAS